ncbi:hypothetical protein FRC00_005569 [Tulasnella sp. 408]|nr:hypothetical protein FRC00_005569 [Tulasnella sp. 408]
MKQALKYLESYQWRASADRHCRQSYPVSSSAAGACYARPAFAQAIFSSMEDARGELGDLISLGVFYTRQRRYAKQKGASLRRVAFAIVPDEGGEAKALDNLMGVYVLQRKFGDAKAACMEACEISTQRGHPMTSQALVA